MSYRPKGETTHYILCIASLRGPPIGGQDRDGASYRCSAPYTLSRFAGLPLKGKREIRGEKQRVIYFRYHSDIPPLVAGATTFPPRWEACHLILSRLRLLANQVPLPPQAGALWMLSNGAMSLQESIETYSAP